MYQVIIVVHVLLGLGVIGLVMMQQGKGADAGAAFAGGGSGSVFGAQGAASFLSRTTAIFAALFFATSLGMAILSSYTTEPQDLMDAPELEQPLADVPVIGDLKPSSDSAPVIPDTSVVPEVVEKATPITVDDVSTAVEPAIAMEETPVAAPVVNEVTEAVVAPVPVVEESVIAPVVDEVVTENPQAVEPNTEIVPDKEIIVGQ